MRPRTSSIDDVSSSYEYRHSADLALDHNHLLSNFTIPASNNLTSISVSITLSLHRRLRHSPNQAHDKRHNQHQQRGINIERNLRRNSARVKTIRNRLASRLKRAERTPAARGLFDVGGEGAEDPVELQLGPVAGDEEDEVGEVGL